MLEWNRLLSQLLKHIDAIAREKNRDVLFLHFDYYVHQMGRKLGSPNVDGWAREQGSLYAVFRCGSNVYSEIYLGGLYLDVPFDLHHKTYQKLSGYLEDEQGNMKIKGIRFLFYL